MTSIGLCSTSNIMTFDQNCHYLYSSSAGGKDLSNDTQIRLSGSMEPKICMKMLRNFIEKCGAKFLAKSSRSQLVMCQSIPAVPIPHGLIPQALFFLHKIGKIPRLGTHKLSKEPGVRRKKEGADGHHWN